MKAGGYILAALLIVASCGRSERPKGILTQRDMVRVLTEIYIAEEKVQRLGIRPDSATKVFERIHPVIFERTGVPDSVFRRSLQYYMERPKELEKIYSVLVDSLNLMEQRTSFEIEAQ